MTIHLTYRDPVSCREEKVETSGRVSRVTVRNFFPNEFSEVDAVLVLGTRPNHRIIPMAQIQEFWVEED
jgi:hypothetical protein